MKHHIFQQSSNFKYSVAILSNSTSFIRNELERYYVNELVKYGIPSNNIIAFTLEQNADGKTPVSFIKEYLASLLKELDKLQVQIMYVASAPYFKVLSGNLKADPYHGYICPCVIKGYEHIQVVLGINYQQLIYNPDLKSKLNTSLKIISDYFSNNYTSPGTHIIHSEYYPKGYKAIREALASLHQYPSLTCDIEGFSLKFYDAKIATISFAWDQHNGIAFACDYTEVPEPEEDTFNSDYSGLFGFPDVNLEIRQLLKQFFIEYQGELTFHSGTYDIKSIIYTLWMKNLADIKGMLTGLDIMTRRVHDTKIMAYLATNSTAGNVLKLKVLAQEFAGNWAVDEIKDIRKVKLHELLRYNLVDALSTFYVRNKYEPVLIRDNQYDLYKGLMLDSHKLIIQLELTGMPMSRNKIQEVKTILTDVSNKQLDTIQNSNLIKIMNLLVQEKAMTDANAKLKVKQHPLEKFSGVKFNPNSNPQMQRLLYDQMGLPVIDYTDTKQPATGQDTIEKLINHATDPLYKELLEALLAYAKVSKILNTFIPAFERAIGKDNSDIVYLFGSFNLGGAVSGRLSSSDPNLQNLPATSIYGKLIKSCFMAAMGWIMIGADFNSLEDMISALTTKDKNKLKVYTDGYCGHCLRAAFYFKDKCSDIDSNDPVSVNSMKIKYPELRQDSKAPTFLLTYGGTYHGLMNNLGWSEEKAKAIDKNYHDLYHESDEYIQAKLKQASKDGYVTVAFGLRLRTPLLSQVIFGSKSVPFAAQAEGRTAGNALGQSYGLLNNRAAVAFMKKVWVSPYRYDILPISLIHDAIYLIVRDDVRIVKWVNDNLIQEMKWQELPEIQHPTVKLGANLDIFWPSWATPITLPNDCDRQTIIDLCEKTKKEIK